MQAWYFSFVLPGVVFPSAVGFSGLLLNTARLSDAKRQQQQLSPAAPHTEWRKKLKSSLMLHTAATTWDGRTLKFGKSQKPTQADQRKKKIAHIQSVFLRLFLKSATRLRRLKIFQKQKVRRTRRRYKVWTHSVLSRTASASEVAAAVRGAVLPVMTFTVNQ